MIATRATRRIHTPTGSGEHFSSLLLASSSSPLYSSSLNKVCLFSILVTTISLPLRHTLPPLLAFLLLLLSMQSCQLSLAASHATSQHSLRQQVTAAATSQQTFKSNEKEKSSEFWLDKGRQELERALARIPNEQLAKSAILFIGDGMSLTTIAAARILHGQVLNKSGEEGYLSFEQLNSIGLLKTYNLDQQIPDSAATATALLTGVKSNFYTLGVNGNVKLNDTNCAHAEKNKLDSILKLAISAGKSTGLVTNTRITHATPAAAYAHVANRRWECDSNMPQMNSGVSSHCKDIARQLIEDSPGNELNVVLGGGRRCFFGNDTRDPGNQRAFGQRADGRNLIDSWIKNRRSLNETNFAFVNSSRELRSVELDKTDYLLGLFSFSHMSYDELRDQSDDGEPSLAEMTVTAIQLLSKNPQGFVLVIESGRIDHAHHENVAGKYMEQESLIT